MATPSYTPTVSGSLRQPLRGEHFSVREAREEAEPEDETLVFTLIRSLNHAVDNFRASERETVAPQSGGTRSPKIVDADYRQRFFHTLG
jgi:hypothetical protein